MRRISVNKCFASSDGFNKKSSGMTLRLTDEQTPEPPDDQDPDEESVNFLDRQFFDPSQVQEDSPLKWFANLVEQDYVTAEALYASVIGFLLVVVSQELLRFQLYGDRYVPFRKVCGDLW
jgi:hypothetical protein